MGLSSVGLAAGRAEPEAEGSLRLGSMEVDLRRQRGSEYDFFTSLGMRGCATGSGMSTQVS